MINDSLSEGLDSDIENMLKGELDHFLETESNTHTPKSNLKTDENMIRQEIAEFDLYEDNNLEIQSEPNTVANSVIARGKKKNKDPHNMIIFDGKIKNTPMHPSNKENGTIRENSLDKSYSPRIYMAHAKAEIKEEFKSSNKMQKYSVKSED